MIIPARWYAGGKGLDEFRNEMLNDNKIRKLVDFENSQDVFPGVDVAGGICYFLWNRDFEGLCEVTNQYEDGRVSTERNLNEFDIFIRHSKSIPIINKISSSEKTKINLNQIISPRKPFGISGNYKPSNQGIKCHFTQRQGICFVNKNDVSDRLDLIDKWKLLIPYVPIAGQTDFSKPVGFYYDGNTIVSKPGECCSETWLVAYHSDSREEIINFRSYLYTKTVRFLLLQSVISQHVTRSKFIFIPHLGNYDIEYTDEILIKRWGITDDEWSFIDSKIKAIE